MEEGIKRENRSYNWGIPQSRELTLTHADSPVSPLSPVHPLGPVAPAGPAGPGGPAGQSHLCTGAGRGYRWNGGRNDLLEMVLVCNAHGSRTRA